MPRLTIALLAAAFACSAAPAPASAAPPPIKHVFTIVLENHDFGDTFGKDSKAPYLAHTLPAKGQLLTKYYGTAHNSLPNYIALVSGQGPNPQTQADCQFFTEFTPGVIGADGQAMGSGCVYPDTVKTVADQLTAKGLTWGGYMEDMGTPCLHPDLNAHDETQTAKADNQYAARHNPFVYFHSIIDSPDCVIHNVDLSRLPGALDADAVPNYVFITPDLCSDGHDAPCVDGRPGGLESIDAFLRTWVPQILRSRAYRSGGLLVITFDESESGAESCCVDDAPNTPNAGATTSGRGGGLIGAVLLSPYIKPGSRNATPYNHYSLLRSVEDLFGLDQLGFAKRSKGFGDDVYNGPRCIDTPVPAGTGALPRGTLINAVKRRGRKLSIVLVRSAKVTVRAALANGPRRTFRRRGVACRTVRVLLPRRTRSVKVVAVKSGRPERRSLSIR